MISVLCLGPQGAGAVTNQEQAQTQEVARLCEEARHALDQSDLSRWLTIARRYPVPQIVSTLFESRTNVLSMNPFVVQEIRILLANYPDARAAGIRLMLQNVRHAPPPIWSVEQHSGLLKALIPFGNQPEVLQIFSATQWLHLDIVVPTLLRNGGHVNLYALRGAPISHLIPFFHQNSDIRREVLARLRNPRSEPYRLLSIAQLLYDSPSDREVWPTWLALAQDPGASSTTGRQVVLWREAFSFLERHPELRDRRNIQSQLHRRIEAALQERRSHFRNEGPILNDAADEDSFLRQLPREVLLEPYLHDHVQRTLEQLAPLGIHRIPAFSALLPQFDRLPLALQSLIQSDLGTLTAQPRHRVRRVWDTLEAQYPSLPLSLQRILEPQLTASIQRSPLTAAERLEIPALAQRLNARLLPSITSQTLPPLSPQDRQLLDRAIRGLDWGSAADYPLLRSLEPFLLSLEGRYYVPGSFMAEVSLFSPNPISDALGQGIGQAGSRQGLPRFLRNLAAPYFSIVGSLDGDLSSRGLGALQELDAFLRLGQAQFAQSASARGQTGANPNEAQNPVVQPETAAVDSPIPDWLASPAHWIADQVRRAQRRQQALAQPDQPGRAFNAGDLPNWAVDRARAAILTDQPHLSPADLHDPNVQRLVNRRAQDIFEMSAQANSARPLRSGPGSRRRGSRSTQMRRGQQTDGQRTNPEALPLDPVEASRIERRASAQFRLALRTALQNPFARVDILPVLQQNEIWRSLPPSQLENLELVGAQDIQGVIHPLVRWQGQTFALRYRDQTSHQLRSSLTSDEQVFGILAHVIDPGSTLEPLENSALAHRVYLASRLTPWMVQMARTFEVLQQTRPYSTRTTIGELTHLGNVETSNLQRLTHSITAPTLLQALLVSGPRGSQTPLQGSIGIVDSWRRAEAQARRLNRPSLEIEPPASRAQPRTSASFNYRPTNTPLAILADTTAHFAVTQIPRSLGTRLQAAIQRLASAAPHDGTLQGFLTETPPGTLLDSPPAALTRGGQNETVVELPVSPPNHSSSEARSPTPRNRITVETRRHLTSTHDSRRFGLLQQEGLNLISLELWRPDGTVLQANTDYRILQNPTSLSYSLELLTSGDFHYRAVFEQPTPEIRLAARAPGGPTTNPPFLQIDRIARLLPQLEEAGFQMLAQSLRRAIQAPNAISGGGLSISQLAEIFESQARYTYRPESALPGARLSVPRSNLFHDFVRFVDEEGRACAQCDGTNALFVEFVNAAAAPEQGLHAELALGYQIPARNSRQPIQEVGIRQAHAVTRILVTAPPFERSEARPTGAQSDPRIQTFYFDVTPLQHDPLSPRLEPTEQELSARRGFLSRMMDYFRRTWQATRQRLRAFWEPNALPPPSVASEPGAITPVPQQLRVNVEPAAYEQGFPEFSASPQSTREVGRQEGQQESAAGGGSTGRENQRAGSSHLPESPSRLLSAWQTYQQSLRRNHAHPPAVDQTHPLRLWPKLLELAANPALLTWERMIALYPEGAVPGILTRSRLEGAPQPPLSMLAQLMVREHRRFSRILAGDARTSRQATRNDLTPEQISWLDRISQSVRALDPASAAGDGENVGSPSAARACRSLTEIRRVLHR